jgi:hypothetical protein
MLGTTIAELKSLLGWSREHQTTNYQFMGQTFEQPPRKNIPGGRIKELLATVLTILLACSCSFAIQAEKQKPSTGQTGASADAKSQGNLKADPGSVTLDAGSQINAEIVSTLDLKKAKPGDPFKMKTTRPVKSAGKEIIGRGSTITGHVQQVSHAGNAIQTTLVFDQLEDKKRHSMSPLSAVVTAVARAENSTSAMAGEEAMPAPMSSGGGRSTRTQSSSNQSGGLLGGVTQTVGGVTQTAAGATGQLGSTVNSTTSSTVRSTSGVTGAAGGLTRGTIQIVNDTTAGATSGSTLALSDRSARIESGTQFVLQTTSALTLTKEAKQK